MIERYRHGEEVSGAAAYIRDAGGERLDRDEHYGTLWRRERKLKSALGRSWLAGALHVQAAMEPTSIDGIIDSITILPLGWQGS
jgi:hypothetical protein